MYAFPTTTELLVPHTQTNTDVIPQELLSQHVRNLLEAQRQVEEQQDQSHRGNYDTLTAAIRQTLIVAQVFDSAGQCKILETITSILWPQANPPPADDASLSRGSSSNSKLLQELGWDFLEWLEPYLTASDGDASTCHKVRALSSTLLRNTGKAIRPQEVYIFASEQMSLVDWDSIASDEEAAVRAIIKIVNYFGVYGEALKRTTDAKVFLDNAIYPASYCMNALDFLGKVLRQHASLSDENVKPGRWNHIVEVMANSVLDFIELLSTTAMHQLKEQKADQKIFETVARISIARADVALQQWYLSVHLLLDTFEKIISAMDMQLLVLYAHRFAWKYNIRRPFEKPPQAIDKYSSRSTIVELVFRCSKIALTLGITVDGVIRLRRSLEESTDSENEDTKSDQVTSERYPLSYDGIVSFLAISLYDSYLDPGVFESHNLKLLPAIVLPKWIGHQCLGPILQFIGNAQISARVDKALFILVVLANEVEADITIDTFTDLKLPGPLATESTFTMRDALQVVCNTAANNPHPNLRLAAYQLISCFIDMCETDTQLFVFMDLLDAQHSPPMQAAAVGLLKERVVNAFDNKLQDSIFNTRVITDKLFPHMFRKPATKALWATLAFHMQLLNLYLYLLMRDRYSKQTHVWEDDMLDWVEKTYLRPLREAIAATLSSISEDQEQMIQLNLLQITLDQVIQERNKK